MRENSTNRKYDYTLQWAQWVFLIDNKCIDSLFEITLDGPPNVGKYISSTIACACSLR